MAWSQQGGIYNLLTRYADVLRQEPYSYQQVNSGFQSYAPEVWIQSDRQSLAGQLWNEVQAVTRWLGYRPFPAWYRVVLPLDRYLRYNKQQLIVSEGFLQGFGVRAVELIDADATVTYTGDSGTVSVTTPAVTDGSVMLFFRTTDGAVTLADERYMIPATVSYSGGAYTFTAHKANFVKPSVQTDFVNGDPKQRNKLDPNTATNFVTAVDIYRVYNDTTVQAQLLSLDVNNAVQAVNVPVSILNAELGYIALGQATTASIGVPHAVTLNVYGGYALDAYGNVDSVLEEVICARAKANAPLNARLSTAPPNTLMYAFADTNSANDANGQGFLPNPIGTRNIDVWTFRKLYPYVSARGSMLDKRWYIGAP